MHKDKRFWVLCVALVYVAAVSCRSNREVSNRTLVVLENIGMKSSHSQYFKTLEGMGHVLRFAGADDSDLELREKGEWKYENLVLFTPGVDQFGGSLDVSSILEFIDSGRNVLVAADENTSDTMRELAVECGIEFDDEGTVAIDHVNFTDMDVDGIHTTFLTDGFVPNRVILGDKLSKPVLFKGIAMSVEEDNTLITKLLTATQFGYSANPTMAIKHYPESAGQDTLLVAALQARNSARVTFSGSLDMFSDKFMSSSVVRNVDGKRFEKVGNKGFAKELSLWTFQHRGVLKVEGSTHHKVGESEPRSTYVVKDELFYSITISEWNGSEWVPFNADDVQLEFSMMDPKIRKTIPSNGKGVYELVFVAPDHYGVYTFRMRYQRPGYTFLEDTMTAAVRPFRHNEFERFIPQAYPYYGSSFALMASVLVFSIFFLYSKESK